MADREYNRDELGRFAEQAGGSAHKASKDAIAKHEKSVGKHASVGVGQDHDKAADAHDKAAKAYRSAGRGDKAAEHEALSSHHRNAASSMYSGAGSKVSKASVDRAKNRPAPKDGGTYDRSGKAHNSLDSFHSRMMNEEAAHNKPSQSEGSKMAHAVSPGYGKAYDEAHAASTSAMSSNHPDAHYAAASAHDAAENAARRAGRHDIAIKHQSVARDHRSRGYKAEPKAPSKPLDRPGQSSTYLAHGGGYPAPGPSTRKKVGGTDAAEAVRRAMRGDKSGLR